ncbi:MAG: DUF4040 domain-containing protein [Cyanobacteria bacterium J06634_5]
MTNAITDEFYMVAITALLPMMAGLLVLQRNPYHALVIRGILGAIAALVYALYGAADVALTEALVGTMLSITLYAIAVRSSMTVRIGVVENNEQHDHPLIKHIQSALNKYYVRIEKISYPDLPALTAALQEKEIQVAYGPSNTLQTRIQRLYGILQAGLPPDTNLSYTEPIPIGQPKHQPTSDLTQKQS